MTCREVADFLMEYEEGALPAAQRAAFEAHLHICRSCVNYLGSYRTTLALETEAAADEIAAPPLVPDDLVRAILASRKT